MIPGKNLHALSRPSVNVYVRSAKAILFFGCLVLCAIFIPPHSRAQSPAASAADLATTNPFDSPAVEQKVDDLLHKMTLQERIDQLDQYSVCQATSPTSVRTDDQV